MPEIKHTVGPWVVSGGFGTGWLVAAPSADTMGIAYVVGRTEVKANARLIAAAPDLLAAAQEALACLADLGEDETPVPILRAAIAKAGGADA